MGYCGYGLDLEVNHLSFKGFDDDFHVGYLKKL